MQKETIALPKIDTLEPVTLGSVLKLIATWRANKKMRREKIPREIWDKIFFLVKTVPVSRVLSALGITRQQWQNEQQERHVVEDTCPAKPPAAAALSDDKSAPPTEFAK